MISTGAVDRTAGVLLTDLVQLVRHAIQPKDIPLKPYAEEVRIKYAVWKAQQSAGGVRITAEQEQWLDRMVEHIATSLVIEAADFETGWFGQHGSLGHALEIFGDRLQALMVELNAKLAA